MNPDMSSSSQQKRVQRRIIGKSISEALSQIHSDPIYGLVEGCLNSFTGIKDNPSHLKRVCITLSAGPTYQDTYIVDSGTGITNYTFLENNAGYDTDAEEWRIQQRDPDYLNKMGLGIPTIASMSKEGIAEFRSVCLNKKGQEEGLVATYTLRDGGGFEAPAERPDSRYVFEVDGAKAEGMKTGTWVIVKNAKHYSVERVYKLLSKMFQLKLTQPGYGILLRDKVTDEWTEVRPLLSFCHKHIETIGYIDDPKLGRFPVYADLHPAQKTVECNVDVLIKRVTMDSYANDYMVKGWIRCDCLNYTPSREGLVIDKDDPKFQQLEELFELECKRQRFDKKPTEHMRNQRQNKKWSDRAKDCVLKYYQRFPSHHLLRLKSLTSLNSDLKGQPLNEKITRPVKRCQNGLHWNPKTQRCEAVMEHEEEGKGEKGTGEKRGTYEKHRKRKIKGRQTTLSDQYTDQSVPNFSIDKRADPNKFCIWIDEEHTAIVLNTHYPWIEDAYENADSRTMDMLLNIAIMNAIPQNRDLTPENFMIQMANLL